MGSVWVDESVAEMALEQSEWGTTGAGRAEYRWEPG